MMNLYDQLDLVRRWQGQMLDMMGFAPIETPSRVLFSTPPVTLKAYGDEGEAGLSLLIVPAPIKRAYIWDLVPWASVVRHCLRHGIRVYLIQWEQPGAAEQDLGLEFYADQAILACLDAIIAESGQRRVFIAGHSLGGTFAAIFSALHGDRVQGLMLLSSPLQFGPDAGDLAPLVAHAPRTQLLTKLLGTVPGSFLSTVGIMASPTSFIQKRWVDWLQSLPDVRAQQIHLRVLRWALDEMPLPRQLFEEVVELLYRENRFLGRTLMVRGHRAAPESMALPILSVVDPRSRVVPPQSILPFYDVVRSDDKRVLWYMGDVGVALQHVGMLVGQHAHQELWPEIIQWLHAHSEGE